MARPQKDGLGYWPRDVDLREDKKVKLIKAEFGLKGVYLFEEILNSVYRTNGYYKKWDDDDYLLMSEGVGCGCTPKLITEVLQGCLKRSLFDQRVFQLFSVLTSVGIQKRFLQIVSNNREKIPIAEEYWLLEKRVVPAATFDKLTFFSVSLTENPINLTENPPNLTIYPQRKEKEINDDDDVRGRAQGSFPVFWGEEQKRISPEELFSKYFGRPPAEAERNACMLFLREYDNDVLELAFFRACERDNKNFAYVRGIMENYEKRGVRTMADVANDDMRHDQSKRRRRQ